MFKIISVLIILLIIGSVYIYPQACCTVGSSIATGGERGAIPPNTLSTAFLIQHNILNSAYESSQQIDDPLNRKSTVTNFNLEIEYGLVNRVSILLILPYTNRTRETNVTNSETNDVEVVSFTGQGLGDIIILGKYEIISPCNFEVENNGTRLSIDLQPGTGAIDLLLWGHILYGFPSIGLSANANFLYRYAGVNLDSYRFGDEFLASINGTYTFAEFLAINLQLKGRWAAEDYWNGRFLPSTGGVYIDLTPSLIYYEEKFSLRVFFQIPVHRNVQGIQLAVNEMLGTEISYIFNLK
jgi:hypothetical protein